MALAGGLSADLTGWLGTCSSCLEVDRIFLGALWLILLSKLPAIKHLPCSSHYSSCFLCLEEKSNLREVATVP